MRHAGDERVAHRAADCTPKGIDYNPDVSPDGRFVAYQSNESGRFESPRASRSQRVDEGQWRGVGQRAASIPCWARNGAGVVLPGSLERPHCRRRCRCLEGAPRSGVRMKLFNVPSGVDPLQLVNETRVYDAAARRPVSRGEGQRR